MANIISAVIGFVLFVAILLVSPIITIWALNTLFSLQIEYGVTSYLATAWLTGLLILRVRSREKKSNGNT